MESKTDEKEDVFTRLYGQVASSAATRKRPSDKIKHRRTIRSTKSCPLLDASVATMSVATPCPQATLDGDPNDPHTLLRGVFQFYCRYGRTGAHGTSEVTMDNANFAKFCRECPDLVVKAKGVRRIAYPMFLEALGIIATKKYPDMALTSALPTLMDAHIAKLGCLDHARSPGKSTWRRRAAATEERIAVATTMEPSNDNGVVTKSEPLQMDVNLMDDTNQLEPIETVVPPPAPFAAKLEASGTNNGPSSLR
ncbi:hypothetical protein, variant [Aphanomyces invadans]|uniref:Uncharacterized protein n=1 Tax=Aphanomyces invadans TaxID=157072 RepID=A0A024UCE6_9STRA|nr:hypothetical protein, variant [Aphanomyces invadans]ETW03308.1 hypothetical protein, variant [Aphanomyces invadans]|eukprot:XP_008867537.1 hypothetical protein, variant [Aphanomyces invadans]